MPPDPPALRARISLIGATFALPLLLAACGDQAAEVVPPSPPDDGIVTIAFGGDVNVGRPVGGPE